MVWGWGPFVTWPGLFGLWVVACCLQLVINKLLRQMGFQRLKGAPVVVERLE